MTLLASLWVLQGALAIGQGKAQAQTNEVEGLARIEDGLEKVKALDLVVPLSFADGEIDLLLVGAPACRQCMNFMEDELGSLVSAAKEKELDLAYMPFALTNYDLTLSAIGVCAMPQAAIGPESLVGKSYAAMEDIAEVINAVQRSGSFKPDDARAGQMSVDAALERYHIATGSPRPMDDDCIADTGRAFMTAIDGLVQVFEVTDLPAMFARGPEGSVLQLAGGPQGRSWETLVQ